jgi:flagellar hook protein FlgE
MSFNVGLSGLRAANTSLDVTGNNIANVATVGFKSSRAEFADQYSQSIRGTSGGSNVGSGVYTSGVTLRRVR